MLRAFIKCSDGTISTDASPESLTRAVKDLGARFWLDMANPEDEDYGLLDEVFGFHPLAIEDAINRSQRPKIESYRHVGDGCVEGYFYMVVHGPQLGNAGSRLE